MSSLIRRKFWDLGEVETQRSDIQSPSQLCKAPDQTELHKNLSKKWNYKARTWLRG